MARTAPASRSQAEREAHNAAQRQVMRERRAAMDKRGIRRMEASVPLSLVAFLDEQVRTTGHRSRSAVFTHIANDYKIRNGAHREVFQIARHRVARAEEAGKRVQFEVGPAVIRTIGYWRADHGLQRDSDAIVAMIEGARLKADPADYAVAREIAMLDGSIKPRSRVLPLFEADPGSLASA